MQLIDDQVMSGDPARLLCTSLSITGSNELYDE